MIRVDRPFPWLRTMVTARCEICDDALFVYGFVRARAALRFLRVFGWIVWGYPLRGVCPRCARGERTR